MMTTMLMMCLTMNAGSASCFSGIRQLLGLLDERRSGCWGFLRHGDLPQPQPSPSGTHLLIIDPQISFHPADASLGLPEDQCTLPVPGAIEDSQRMAKFIRDSFTTDGSKIDAITVTLDTHSVYDTLGRGNIGFPEFWRNMDQVLASPGKIGNVAMITMDTTGDKVRYMASNILDASHPAHIQHGTPVEVMAAREEDAAWLLEYATQCQQSGTDMLVWPHHCLEGQQGFEIFPELQLMLNAWERKTGKFVRYERKAQYPLTDMYSVFRPVAYVPKHADDRGDEQEIYTETRRGNSGSSTPYNRNGEPTVGEPLLYANGCSTPIALVESHPFTRDVIRHNNIEQASAFNSDLYNDLMKYSQIVIGGEAMSHCVKDSVTHLVTQMKQDGRDPSIITVLEDTTSPVPGFTQVARDFVANMRMQGVRFVKAADYYFRRFPQQHYFHDDYTDYRSSY